MTIGADGWFDWAERDPGPPDKRYSEPNRIEGFIPHSMVGFFGAARDRLFNRSRLPSGQYTEYARASWIGSVLYDGTLIEHYSVMTSAWTSGAREPNVRFPAFEFEGGPPGRESEPLTDAQLATAERIVRDLMAFSPRFNERRRPDGPADRDATLYEHREMTRFGALPTACPSERMRELWRRLTREPRRPEPAPKAEEVEMAKVESLLRIAGNALWLKNRREAGLGIVDAGGDLLPPAGQLLGLINYGKDDPSKRAVDPANSFEEERELWEYFAAQAFRGASLHETAELKIRYVLTTRRGYDR